MGKYFKKYGQLLNADVGASVFNSDADMPISNSKTVVVPTTPTTVVTAKPETKDNTFSIKNMQQTFLNKVNTSPLLTLRQRIAGPESGDRDTYADGSPIISPKRAAGRLQITPGTAKTYGHVNDDWKTNKDIQYEIYDKYMADHMRMAKMDPNNLTPTQLNALAASWYGGAKAMFAYLKQSQNNVNMPWLDKNQNITKDDGTVLKFPSINQYVNRIKF